MIPPHAPRPARGFTLIELLVVIAIIAILAAILFPVFAQAKLAAKKTQALSNVKNVVTGQMIYLSDSDDVFPLANIFMPDGGGDGARNTYNRFVPTPQALATAYTNAAGLDALGSWYANSTRAYIKSEAIYDDPAATSTTSIYTLSVTATTGSATPIPPAGTPNYGYAMNGLLTQYNATGINAPASIPLISGMGLRKTPGATFANPALFCPHALQACVYQKAASNCGTSAVNGDASFFTRSTGGAGWDTYNGQWMVGFADGHAKSRKIGIKTTGATDPRVDPFTNWMGTNGSTNAMHRWYSAENAGGCHAYQFRPDFDPNSPDTAVENL